MIIKYNQQVKEDRALRNQRIPVKSRFVSEHNPKIDKLNEIIHKKMNHLKTAVKSSTKMDLLIIQVEKKTKPIKQHKTAKQIANVVDKIPLNEQ